MLPANDRREAPTGREQPGRTPAGEIGFEASSNNGQGVPVGSGRSARPDPFALRLRSIMTASPRPKISRGEAMLATILTVVTFPAWSTTTAPIPALAPQDPQRNDPTMMRSHEADAVHAQD